VREKDQKLVVESLKLVAKNWKILNVLSAGEYYGGELADKLGKSAPEVSLRLKKLGEKGLVGSHQKQGERRKYFFLTNLGNRVIEAVTEAMQLEPEGKLEEWQIDNLLAILNDAKLGESVRAAYSGVFRELSHESPIALIEHAGVRETIKRIVIHPTVYQFNANLTQSVSLLLSNAVQNQKWRDWAVKDIYPILIENIESGNEKTKVWAIKQAVKLATLGSEPKLTSDVRERLLELWFSDNTDVSSNFGNEVMEQLVLVCLYGGSKNAQAMFDELKSKASEERSHLKEKAEALLGSLKECLLPKKQIAATTTCYSTRQTGTAENLGTS